MNQPDQKALLLKIIREDIKRLKEKERILKQKYYQGLVFTFIIIISLIVIGYNI